MKNYKCFAVQLGKGWMGLYFSEDRQEEVYVIPKGDRQTFGSVTMPNGTESCVPVEVFGSKEEALEAARKISEELK